MSERTKQQAQVQEDAKRAAAQQRNDQVMGADYSAATNFDELYDDLASAEIKSLYARNATFKAKVDQLNNAPLPQTTTLGSSQNEIDAARAAEAVQQTTPEPVAQTDAGTPEAIAAAQEEADRLLAEAAAAGTPLTVQRNDVEILYDGVEKLGEGSYKLTVDPEDGTSPEIFYGASQSDCFKGLRKSKASATRELRRRAKKVQITDELRALQVEVINYPPLAKPISLSADEVFTLTQEMKDPVTAVKAMTKLRLASITQEECDRQNEAIERQRYSDGYNTAITWIQTHPDFYNCPENIAALQTLMVNLNWAVTIKNLDLAFDNLVEQGVLLERPVEQTPSQPIVPQPASVVPVVTVAPAVPVVKAAPAVAKTGALPDARQLRPADRSSSTTMTPTRRSDSVPVAVMSSLTAEEYHAMPSATLKMRYQREPAFRVQVDALIASGKV